MKPVITVFTKNSFITPGTVFSAYTARVVRQVVISGTMNVGWPRFSSTSTAACKRRDTYKRADDLIGLSLVMSQGDLFLKHLIKKLLIVVVERISVIAISDSDQLFSQKAEALINITTSRKV